MLYRSPIGRQRLLEVAQGPRYDEAIGTYCGICNFEIPMPEIAGPPRFSPASWHLHLPAHSSEPLNSNNLQLRFPTAITKSLTSSQKRLTMEIVYLKLSKTWRYTEQRLHGGTLACCSYLFLLNLIPHDQYQKMPACL